MINVGLIGIGGMGRMHFDCYRNNPGAKIHAICDRSEAKLRGDWSDISLNLDPDAKVEPVDLSGVETYTEFEQMLADPAIDVIDICLPTPLHAKMTIAALRAGKHVLCEKPMAMNAAECVQMEAVANETGRQLMIGQCLRYWPEYVIAQQGIASGEWGRVLSAHFHRSADVPGNSFEGWMAKGEQSGGAVLDMHIHDVDAALWWFGAPDSIEADGVIFRDLPLSCDAIWRYNDGPVVTLHGSWDPNGAPFRMAFRVVMERASIVYDTATGVFQLWQNNVARELKAPDTLAYQAEIDDFIDCLQTGRQLERVTPAASRLAVEITRREMAMIKAGALS